MFGAYLPQWPSDMARHCSLAALSLAGIYYISTRQATRDLLEPHTRGICEVVMACRSRLISLGTSKSQHQTLRRSFNNDFHVNVSVTKATHPHAVLAGIRTSTERAAINHITSVGMEPYVVSTSARTTTYDGCHYHIIDKDLAFRPRFDRVTSRHYILLVDVDYYVDINYWLSFGQPVMVLTNVPTKLSSDFDGGHYVIDNDAVMTMVIDGGGRYVHRLWDYSRDIVRVRAGIVSWEVYNVSQKLIAGMFRAICFTPLSRVRWFGFLLLGGPIERNSFTTTDEYGKRSKHMISMYHHNAERWVSIKPYDTNVSVELPYAVFEVVRMRVRSSKTFSVGEIQRIVNDVPNKPTDAKVIATVLYHAFQTETTNSYCLTQHDVPPISDVVQACAPLSLDLGKPYGRQYTRPIIENPALIPVKSLNNEVTSIYNRIVKVRNSVVVRPEYTMYAEEFVRMLIPDDIAHKGVPLSFDQIWDEQTTPVQRRRLSSANVWYTDNSREVVSAFLKSEPAANANGARMISQLSPVHTFVLSQITYSFKKTVLTTRKWYGPGKTPREIADHLASLGITSDSLIETDFSKFDGTISHWLRTRVERSSYLRWVQSDWFDFVHTVIGREFGIKGYTPNQVQYNLGSSRLSGSPLTTDGNTIINAFVTYSAHRRSGYSPACAFEALDQCIFAGDDAVSNCSPKEMALVCTDLGLKVKCELKKPGDHVGFLGRIFPELFAGLPGSLQDVRRTLMKCHITVSPMSVELAEAACNRAVGYLRVDPNCPILSVYFRRVLEHYGGREDQEVNIGMFTYDLPYYTCLRHDQSDAWPQLSLEHQQDLVCKELDITRSVLYDIEDYLSTTAVSNYSAIIANEPTQTLVQSVVRSDVEGDGEVAVTFDARSGLVRLTQDRTADKRRQGNHGKDKRTQVHTPSTAAPSRNGKKAVAFVDRQNGNHVTLSSGHGTRGNRQRVELPNITTSVQSPGDRGRDSQHVEEPRAIPNRDRPNGPHAVRAPMPRTRDVPSGASRPAGDRTQAVSSDTNGTIQAEEKTKSQRRNAAAKARRAAAKHRLSQGI